MHTFIFFYFVFKRLSEEALNFYNKIFSAKIENCQTYQDRKQEVSASLRKKLHHAELKEKDLRFTA